MKAKETLIVDYYEFLRVLNKEIKTTDYDFGVYSWEDAFIVELLKWYDNKVSTIKDRKKKWGNGSKEKWEEYYEQMVRMLYFAVIRFGETVYPHLKSIFDFFFEVEDDDPYRDDPYMISAEKLLQVYKYIENKIDKKSYKHSSKHRMAAVHQYPFIGHWNTPMMKDLYDDFCMNYIRSRETMEFLYIHHSLDEKREKAKRKEKMRDEAMKRDCKLMDEILDRMKKRAEDRYGK